MPTSESRRSPIERHLRPQSIAIVGASPTPGSFGASVLINLERASFQGEIYLVNPKRSNIGGRPCIASIDDLPTDVDCAVIAIPRVGVLEAVDSCGRRGVGGIVIFSAGFAEAGEAGRADQAKLAKLAEQYNMVVEGPNCLGFTNYIDAIPMTFIMTDIPREQAGRRVGIVSQSGAMAAVLGVSLRHHDLNFSYSISTGNEAATGLNDFFRFLVDDDNTAVITLIVEQFRDPQRFLKLVSKARDRGKHVVLLHPGASNEARASAATHTGALAGDYNVMRVKVEHGGVLLVETLEELIDCTEILIRCPSLPQGGAAVFTESGAYKALTLDFCERVGLALPELSDAAMAGLRAALPEFIPPSNPLDITAQGLVDPYLYSRCLPPVLNDDCFGSLVLAIILTDQVTSGLKFPPILKALRENRPHKPVLFAGLDEGAVIDTSYVRDLREIGVPFFATSERALRALASVTRYARRRIGEATTELFVAEPALPIGTLPEYMAKGYLYRAGIPVPRGELANNPERAIEIADQLGFPVVLKAQSAALSHKSDAGGVALRLQDATAVQSAWLNMYADIEAAQPGTQLDGILVEEMSAWGTELIVGAHRDPDWGPVLLVGLGGIAAEALGDTRLLVPGLSEEEIVAELQQLKGSSLLRGFRGAPPADVRAVAAIVAALGRFVVAHPEVREVDLNPVIAYASEKGALALDALIVTNAIQ